MAKKYITLENLGTFKDNIDENYQSKLVSGTSIKTVNSTSLLGNGNIDTAELFYCTYGTTTYAEITTALSAGKLPVCVYSDRFYKYDLKSPTDRHTFNANYADTLYTISVPANNTWSAGSTQFEITSNKTQSITSSSTSSQYPSAKAVYDYAQAKLPAVTNDKYLHTNSSTGALEWVSLTNVFTYIGTTTTVISDGSTTNPITINGNNVTAINGNVVGYGNKEFVWNGNAWEELGDEGNATSSTPGKVKLGSDTTQTVAAENVSSTASRTYAIQTNSNGQLVVNVPWSASSNPVQDLTSNTAGTLDATAWGNLKSNHYATISSPTMTGLDSTYEFVNIKLSINSNNEYVKLGKNTTNKYSGLFFIEESTNLYEITAYYNGTNIILRCATVM